VRIRSDVDQHRFDLGLEGLRAERLDDVGVGAGPAGGDDVLGLRFRRHHDEWGRAQIRVGANLAQQIIAGGWLHVPIGNHQAVVPLVHLRECRAAVVGRIDVGEADLLEEIAKNPDHGGMVIHHQHRRRRIERHRSAGPQATGIRT
jgi:hypothetical protein